MTPPPATSEPTVLNEAQSARDKALRPKVEAILDAYGNFDAELSRDGKKVLFRSNRAGIPEVYLGDVSKPGEAPKKLVTGPERVQSARFSHDGKFIVFRKDQGADENSHVWRAAADGSGAVDLTPEEVLHRDDVLLPRKAVDRMVYSARSTTSAETRVVVQAISGGEPVVALVDAGPSFVVDVSPDGKRALFVRFVSPSDQLLLEADLDAKTSRRIYPAEGKRAGVGAVAYSADGKQIFLATDEGGESHTLLSLDATTLAEKARYQQDKASAMHVAEIAVSPRGDRLVIGLDGGNHHEARILDARTLAKKVAVESPLGSLAIGTFADDGRHFTLARSVPDAPTDIFVGDVTTGKLAPLRDDKRAGFADLPPLVTSIETTMAFDGLTIPINVFLPRDLPAGKKLPVIVEFHGGPASSSSISWNEFARFFTAQGFAMVEPNIRGSTGFGRAYEMADNREKRADALKDVASVNEWVKSKPWADPDRVVIFGGSYGGYLVLMGLTRQPKLWRAGVDLVGISNLFTFLASTDQSIRSAFVDEFGDLEKDKALLDQFSPHRDVSSIVAPLFVYQGQNDPRVPRPESDQIVRELRSRKIPVEYMVAANEGHSIDRRETRIEFYTRVARFLDDSMK